MFHNIVTFIVLRQFADLDVGSRANPTHGAAERPESLINVTWKPQAQH